MEMGGAGALGEGVWPRLGGSPGPLGGSGEGGKSLGPCGRGQGPWCGPRPGPGPRTGPGMGPGP